MVNTIILVFCLVESHLRGGLQFWPVPLGAFWTTVQLPYFFETFGDQFEVSANFRIGVLFARELLVYPTICQRAVYSK